MNTSNASSFFQSAETQAKFARQSAKAANNLGNPLQFTTKILDIVNDLEDASHVLIAESGSVSRRVNIETGATTGIYRGHTAPVTCIIDLGNGTIATGSWDKTVRITNKASKETLKVLNAHTDFIKCLLHIPSLGLLLSGSADSHIRAWSLSTFECLYTLKGHARGVECLAIGPDKILYSGGSESSIRRWFVSAERGEELDGTSWIHETSVYAIHYDEETESLWTASADKTARQISVTQDVPFVEESRFEHPDYVRDIVVRHGFLYTACRDENIRVFEIGSGKLRYTLEGHFSEVSGLCLSGNTLVSVSLDATMRRWHLGASRLQAHVQEQDEEHEAETQEGDARLTAEEQAELEELMSDD